MKHYATLLTLFISAFFYTNVHAQNTVKDKIVGCWKLDKMEFADPDSNTQVPEEALNSVVCLQKDGKFVTTSGSQKVNGIYMISDDGKTMTQRMAGGTDDVGEITEITETTLTLKVEDMTIRMKRVKE